VRASGLLACPPPFLSHRLSPVRLKFWCRPADLSLTLALRFNDHPFRIRGNGPDHIAGPAASAARNAAFYGTPDSDHQAPLVRFFPLQRSLAALRCLGLPNPRRSRFSLTLPARRAASAGAGECRLLRFFAAARVEVSRSRPPRTSPRRLGLPVAVTMGGKSLGSRLGGATWSSFGSHRDQCRWEPLPLDDAPGVHALRSFDPACRSDECFHSPAPTCLSPERPSRSLQFSNSGRSAAFFSCVGPKLGPAARQKNLRNDRSRTFRLGSWVCSGSQAVPRGPLCPVAVRYCPGLCLSQVCGHQPVCVLRLDAKHAVSPGTKLQTPSRLQASSPLPGPYAHELRRPFVL